MKIIFKFIFW